MSGIAGKTWTSFLFGASNTQKPTENPQAISYAMRGDTDDWTHIIDLQGPTPAELAAAEQKAKDDKPFVVVDKKDVVKNTTGKFTAAEKAKTKTNEK